MDSRNLCNILTWEAAIALQVNMTGLKKVNTLLVGIEDKPVKVKRSDRDRRRTLRQPFMVAKIDDPYNAIFGRWLLNDLCIVLSPCYLMVKFETNKGIAFIGGGEGPSGSQKKVHASCEGYDKAA